jgi:hypothetical protein
MSSNKLRVCEYFDKLTSKLDLAVESRISHNIHDKNLEDGLNTQREIFLRDSRSRSLLNFRSLSDLNLKPSEVLSDEELFPKFCFFIEYPKTGKKHEFIMRI